jgi:hypothetical protein
MSGRYEVTLLSSSLSLSGSDFTNCEFKTSNITLRINRSYKQALNHLKQHHTGRNYRSKHVLQITAALYFVWRSLFGLELQCEFSNIFIIHRSIHIYSYFQSVGVKVCHDILRINYEVNLIFHSVTHLV